MMPQFEVFFSLEISSWELFLKSLLVVDWLDARIPSWEPTYPSPKDFWVDDFPFTEVGYVSFLEGKYANSLVIGGWELR